MIWTDSSENAPSESVARRVIVWGPAERVFSASELPVPSTPSTSLVQRRLSSGMPPSSRSVAAPSSTASPPSGTSVPSPGFVIATNGALFGTDTVALSPKPVFTPSLANTRRMALSPPAIESTSTSYVVAVRPAASASNVAPSWL